MFLCLYAIFLVNIRHYLEGGKSVKLSRRCVYSRVLLITCGCPGPWKVIATLWAELGRKNSHSQHTYEEWFSELLQYQRQNYSFQRMLTIFKSMGNFILFLHYIFRIMLRSPIFIYLFPVWLQILCINSLKTYYSNIKFASRGIAIKTLRTS